MGNAARFAGFWIGIFSALAVFPAIQVQSQAGWASPSMVLVVMAIATVMLLLIGIIGPRGAPVLFTAAVLCLAVFCGGGMAGIAAASSVTGTPWLATDGANSRVLLASAFVAFFIVGLLLVRRSWMIVPVAQSLSPAPEPVGLLNSGFLYATREGAKEAYRNRIAGATGQDLLMLANDQVEASRSIKALDERRTSLIEDMAQANAEDEVRIVTIAIASSLLENRTAKDIYLMKVQNQLAVLAVLLAGAVGIFGSLGWGAPMVLASVGAVIVRIRVMSPMGDVKTMDGGARWMALFLTPLVGATTAVLGLIVVSAIAASEAFNGILSETVVEGLSIPSLAFSGALPSFSPLALGLALAFGWSGRLLDVMLTKLTDAVAPEDG